MCFVYASSHFFQLILHIHSFCTMNYTKHQTTGKHTESSELEVELNNAQLLYSSFHYRKHNLEHLIVQNMNQKTWKRSLPQDLPLPQKNGLEEEKESSQNQIYCTCIIFMVWFETISSTITLRVIQNLVPYCKM